LGRRPTGQITLWRQKTKSSKGRTPECKRREALMDNRYKLNSQGGKDLQSPVRMQKEDLGTSGDSGWEITERFKG